MAFDLHENREEAEAGVPDDDLLLAAFNDFRINQRPRLLSGQLQEDDAQAHAELRRGNSPAVSGGGAPVGKRIGKVVH